VTRWASFVFPRFVNLDILKKLTDQQLKDVKRLVPSRPKQQNELKHQKRIAELTPCKDVRDPILSLDVSPQPADRQGQGSRRLWEEMLGSGAEHQEFGLRCFRACGRYRMLIDPVVYHMNHPKCPLEINRIPQNRKPWS